MVSSSLLALAFGPYRCLPSISRSIGQPLPGHTAQDTTGAGLVINPKGDTLVMAMVELGDLAVQMLLGARGF